MDVRATKCHEPLCDRQTPAVAGPPERCFRVCMDVRATKTVQPLRNPQVPILAGAVKPMVDAGAVAYAKPVHPLHDLHVPGTTGKGKRVRDGHADVHAARLDKPLCNLYVAIATGSLERLRVGGMQGRSTLFVASLGLGKVPPSACVLEPERLHGPIVIGCGPVTTDRIHASRGWLQFRRSSMPLVGGQSHSGSRLSNHRAVA